MRNNSANRSQLENKLTLSQAYTLLTAQRRVQWSVLITPKPFIAGSPPQYGATETRQPRRSPCISKLMVLYCKILISLITLVRLTHTGRRFMASHPRFLLVFL